MTVEELKVLITAQTADFNKKLDGMQKKLSQVQNKTASVTKKMSNAFLMVGATIAAIGFGNWTKKAIELSSDLQEVQNVVDITFGSMAEQVNQFSKQAISQFGLSELSAKRYASTMGAMLKSSGLTGQAIADMSIKMTSLAADMASFYNLAGDMAFDKIRAGISGETEPLKQLGINMSVANLEAYAMSQGIVQSYNAMSQAEQVMLRYNYLLSVTSDAQGDFARTSDGWANQIRILKEQWDSFAATMGGAFIQILTPVVKALNYLVLKLQVAAGYFKAFVDLISGNKTNSAATGAAVASISMDGMSQSANRVGDAAKKAGKKVKGSLSAFDELNVVSQNIADSANGAAGGLADGGLGGMADVGSVGDMAVGEIDSTQLDIFAAKLQSTFGGAADFLKTTFANAFGGMGPEIEGFKSKLSSIGEDIGKLGEPINRWFYGNLVPLVQNVIMNLGHVVIGLFDSFNKVFGDIWDIVVYPVISKFISVILPVLTEWVNSGVTLFGIFFDEVKAIFDLLWSTGVKPALDVLASIWLGLMDSMAKVWNTWGVPIFDAMGKAVQGTGAVLQNIWETILQPIWQNFMNMVDWLWTNHLQPLWDNINDFFAELIAGGLAIYNEFILPVVNRLVDDFGPAFETVFSLISNVVGSAIGTVIDIINGLITVIKGIVQFVSGVFAGDWERAWKGVSNIFKGIFQGIVGIAKGAVNLIIDAINGMIRLVEKGINGLVNMVNTVLEEVNSVTEHIGFSVPLLPTVQIPKIPKLAKGGLVYDKTLAMVGDNPNASVDPEVISPLSKLRDIVSGDNEQMVEAIYTLIEVVKEKDADITIDGDKLAEILEPKLQKARSRKGRTAIVLG